jgi:nucleotide-binding universal stress UspA family protein
MKDIVVGVDRSDTARTAAERAAELAAAYRTNLHIVMCVERGPVTEFSVGSDHFHIDRFSEADQFLADVARKLPHDRITHAVGVGDPAKMLCEEAGRLGAQAIVVGNRRVQGMSRVLGSVAGDVTKMAPCDVMVANTCAEA